jgi:hypothetical protein
MSRANELGQMKRAALLGVLQHAIRTHAIKCAGASGSEVAAAMQKKLDAGATPYEAAKAVAPMTALGHKPKTKTKTAAAKGIAQLLKRASPNGIRALNNMVVTAAMPPEASFRKVASAMRLDLKVVKATYLQKKGFLLPLAAGLGMGAAAVGGLGMANQLSNGMFNRPGVTPARRAMYSNIYRQLQGNQEISSDLQAMSGVNRPAPNPYGAAGPGSGGMGMMGMH